MKVGLKRDYLKAKEFTSGTMVPSIKGSSFTDSAMVKEY